jgi:hypothetical protein
MNKKELAHIRDLFDKYDLYGYRNIPIVEKTLDFVEKDSVTIYYKRAFAFFCLGYKARKKEAEE